MKKHIVIIGGGIAGLAAAYYLRQHRVTLIEKTDRLGGWVRSSVQQGFLFEHGPRGFRAAGIDHPTLGLVRELGLQPIVADRQAKTRYVAVKGRLQRVSLLWLLRSGLLWAGCKDLFQIKSRRNNETIEAFFSRHCGRRFTKNVIDPLTRGIFGGTMDNLSARSCFPSLWHIDHRTGSLIRGRRSAGKPILYSFQQGMTTLIEALARTPMDLRLNTEVLGVKTHEVQLKGGALTADHIILAVPPHQYPQLLGIPDVHRYVTMNCVHFGWHQSVLKQKGYGFLVPTHEVEDIMGMTFDSHVFPDQPGACRITVFISGSAPDAKLIECAYKSIGRFCHIEQPADVVCVSKATQAIAQYGLDHEDWLRDLETRLPQGLLAMGSGLRGVGLNDCIIDARRMAAQVMS